MGSLYFRKEQKMKLKDFVVGQDAYTVLEHPGRNQEDIYGTVKVIGIGRKYVKTQQGDGPFPPTKEYFVRDEDETFLVENADWGDRAKLFPTMQAFDDYREKKEKYLAVKEEIKLRGLSDFTLDQLRRIFQILEEK